MIHRASVRFSLIAGVVLVYVLSSGKDLNWDALNYHLYAGYEALNERFSNDFMGGGLPGYINPISHIPFYLMVMADWPPMLVASVFAIFHSLNLFLAYSIGWRLLADCPSGWQGWGAWSAVVLAALNPILLQTLGSSFNDASVSVFVLAGWLAMLVYLESGRRRWVLASAVLLGMACGLKLSSVFFAVALTPALLFYAQAWSRRLVAVLIFALGGVFSSALLMAPWAWQLWVHHGNPLFPFFNEVFRSPDMLAEPLKHLRFVPQGWAEVMARPFRMALPLPLVHTEPISPDPRYALMLVFALVAGLLQLTRWRAAVTATDATAVRSAVSRARYALLLCFALAWASWLLASGNSRYFLPMGAIAGVLLAVGFVRLSIRFGDDHRSRARVALVCLLGIVSFQVATSASLRWSQLPWGASWYEVEVPATLREAPVLYLSTSTQSGSFVAPFLSRDAGFMNVSGSFILGPDGPGGRRAVELIKRAGDRLRTLTVIDWVYEDGRPVAPRPEAIDRILSRFDLAVVSSDCELISSAMATLPMTLVEPGITPVPHQPRAWLQSCRVERRPGAALAHLARRQEVEAAMDHIERACPGLFQPVGGVTEGAGGSWKRIYLNSDASLHVLGDKISLFQPFRSTELKDLGTVATWARGAGKVSGVDCR